MTCTIFTSSKNFVENFFFTYIKMSKDLSVKYYQNNKEGLHRKASERYQSIIPKKKKKKEQQYGCER